MAYLKDMLDMWAEEGDPTKPGDYWGTEGTGDRWDKTALALPPIYRYPGPAIAGLPAVEGILSKPYSGIGQAGEARVKAGTALASQRAGHAASRLMQPATPRSTAGGTGPFQPRQEPRGVKGRAGASGRGREDILRSQPTGLEGFGPGLMAVLGKIPNEQQRRYVLWSLLQGDERIKNFLFPYLDAYNQGYGVSKAYENQQSPEGGNWMDDILQLAGIGIGIGGIAACWVARELFGANDPRWAHARYYIIHVGPRWFAWFYIKHGRKWAQFLRRHPRLKPLHMPLFKWMARRGLWELSNPRPEWGAS